MTLEALPNWDAKIRGEFNSHPLHAQSFCWRLIRSYSDEVLKYCACCGSVEVDTFSYILPTYNNDADVALIIPMKMCDACFKRLQANEDLQTSLLAIVKRVLRRYYSQPENN